MSYVPLFVQLEGKRGPAVRLKTGRGGKNATRSMLSLMKVSALNGS